MVGAFSDNQPDYSWIKPYEVKTANLKWYPMQELGGLTQANEDAAMNLELQAENNRVLLAFNSTKPIPGARVLFKIKGQTHYTETIDLAPGKPFKVEIPVPAGTRANDCEGILLAAGGQQIIHYQPAPAKPLAEIPPTVEPPLPPEQILNNEECYLAGLRIQQFHQATVDPQPYFEEVLQRDPGDVRCNVMVGLDRKQRGRYEEAAAHFRQAIARQTKDYTRPRDTEALYHLGVTLQAQGKLSAAYDTLYRATWDYAFFAPAHHHLAEISSARGDYTTALAHCNQALATAAESTITLNLKCALLRKMQRWNEAEAVTCLVQAIDPLDLLVRFELYQLALAQGREEPAKLEELRTAWRQHMQNYLESAVDYLNFGLPGEALKVLELASNMPENAYQGRAELYYFMAFLYHDQGEETKAQEHLQLATNASMDYVFPHRLEMLPVWYYALKKQPRDARAYYFLGNLWYDRQPQEGLNCWQRAVDLAPDLAIAWRNLGFGYHRHLQQIPQAIQFYEQAIRVNPHDPTYYLELDNLYSQNNTAPAVRLNTMLKNLPLMATHNNLFMHYLHVLVLNGQIDQAIKHLNSYFFTAMEGNEWIHDIHVNAHLLQGLHLVKANKKKAALQAYLQATEYPANQRVGKTSENVRDIQVHYYAGEGYLLNGNKVKAQDYFQRAAAQVCGDNEYLYYQALALEKLGRTTEAQAAVARLAAAAEKKLKEGRTTDFFSKFGETGNEKLMLANSYYQLGLARLAQKKMEEARISFRTALEWRADHLWAQTMLKSME